MGFLNVSADISERPSILILPSFLRSANAPTDSSIGTFGSGGACNRDQSPRFAIAQDWPRRQL